MLLQIPGPGLNIIGRFYFIPLKTLIHRALRQLHCENPKVAIWEAAWRQHAASPPVTYPSSWAPPQESHPVEPSHLTELWEIIIQSWLKLFSFVSDCYAAIVAITSGKPKEKSHGWEGREIIKGSIVIRVTWCMPTEVSQKTQSGMYLWIVSHECYGDVYQKKKKINELDQNDPGLSSKSP